MRYMHMVAFGPVLVVPAGHAIQPRSAVADGCEVTICRASVLLLAALRFLFRFYFLVPARPSELVPTKPSLYQVVV